MTLRLPIFSDDIPALNPAVLAESLPKCAPQMAGFRTGRSDIRENADSIQLGSLIDERFLRLGSMMKENEKDSREQPKEL